jgi:hypothetical protein
MSWLFRNGIFALQKKLQQVSFTPSKDENMKHFILFLSLLLMCEAEPLTLDTIIEKIPDSDGIKAVESKIQSLHYKYNASGKNADPKLVLGWSPEPVHTKNGKLVSKVNLSFPFILPEKRRIEKNILLKSLDQAEIQRLVKFRAIEYQATKTYFEYLYLKELTSRTKKILSLYETWYEVAKVHYSHQNQSWPHLVSFETEISSIKNKIKNFEARRTPISAKINSLISQSQASILPWPRWNKRIVEHIKLSIESNASPQTLLYEKIAEQLKLQSELSHQKSKPNFNFGVELQNIEKDLSKNESGDDALMIFAGFNLPLHKQSYRDEANSFLSLRDESLYQKKQTAELIDAKISLLNNTLEETSRDINLNQSILIPRLKENLQSIETTYSNSNMNLAAILDNLRIQLQLEVATAASIRDYWTAFSELNSLRESGKDSLFSTLTNTKSTGEPK